MKHVLVILTFLCCSSLLSQEHENTSKFKFHSVSLTPLVVSKIGSGDGGGSIYADISASKDHHLFSVQFGTGSELDILEKNDSYSEFNFLYGRQFRINKNMYWDMHAGAGYFSFTTFDRNANNGIGGDVTSKTIGVPLTTKLRFMLGNKFSLGLQFHVNFNAESVIYNGGLVFQFNFKAKQ